MIIKEHFDDMVFQNLEIAFEVSNEISFMEMR